MKKLVLLLIIFLEFVSFVLAESIFVEGKRVHDLI
jgi:hypothetical protein